MLTGSEIRRKFLDFFVQKGHREVHSSSLVPQNDPTLLFTNAGMNQFKDVFLGLEKRDYDRATTSQKCVRAGGKHNDLENVGFTNRHHTFFEMLGNFSFGDYFKKDAIAYAWELITSKDWYGIDKEKLYITIFEGTPLASGTSEGIPRDDEAEQIWLAVGVPKDRIFAMGMKDNFWQMGDTGPCGPCSEIHYDMGVAASDQGHTDCKFGCECGRYVEIWNLVFMQYNRQPRVPDGTLFGFDKLPKPSIDTGAGLERLTAVLRGVISNYDTDLFSPLILQAAILCHLEGAGSGGFDYRKLDQRTQASLRIIADHARAMTFLISDGVVPSNEGRGYVLRKIMRRALRHVRLSGGDLYMLTNMARVVVGLMAGGAYEADREKKFPYPELWDSKERIEKIIRAEEDRFGHTLDAGLKRLEADLLELVLKVESQGPEWSRSAERLKNLPPAGETASGFIISESRRWLDDALARLKTRHIVPTYPGESAFQLYDTFGLPLDFIIDAVRDLGISFDQEGFDRAMTEQRARARASWKGSAKQTANPVYQALAAANVRPTPVHGFDPRPPSERNDWNSEFFGYKQTRLDDCRIIAIIHNGQGAQQLSPGDEGEIILDHTPFYADSGGQVGDKGWLYSDDHNTVVAEVKGCYAPIQGVRAHQVVAKQPIRVGDKVDAVVNADIRNATMRNHTATHLLHAGLREVLGKHVKQAGSLVAPNHLRFDFSHFTAVEDEELQDIEDIINKEVLRNMKVETLTDVPIDEAISKYHAMALFGEKYGDKVRVVRIGEFSTELCGGTHTAATGEIGLIKILKEGSVSSGVRRVEAITGMGSLAHFRMDHELEGVVSAFASPTLAQKPRKDGAPSADDLHAHAETITPAEALKAELDKKDAEIKKLTRELDQARMKSASSSTANISDQIKEVKGVKVLAHRVDNLERAQLRTLIDQLRDKIGSGVVVLGSATDGNVSLIVGVTKDLTARVQAGKVIGPVAQKVGGKGGGRPDLAEAGGKDAAALDSALGSAYSVVEALLG